MALTKAYQQRCCLRVRHGGTTAPPPEPGIVRPSSAAPEGLLVVNQIQHALKRVEGGLPSNLIPITREHFTGRLAAPTDH